MKLAFALRLSFLVAATLSVLPGPARAQDGGAAPFAPPPAAPPGAATSSSTFAPVPASAVGFGGAGQWVVSMSTANASSNSFFVHLSDNSTDINLHPAVDYFLVPKLSIGGEVGFSHGSGGVTTLEIGARVGYALVIGGPIGFWPTAGVFGGYDTGNHMSNGHASLGIFAPFLLHPAAHFFVGLGPAFNLGLSGGNGTEFGIDFTLGGWI